MNLKQLKLAFDISDGDLYFVADDPIKQAIKKKLTTPPLQGRVDITIKKRGDGVDIVYLPKSKKNIYAFEHLLVIDPSENAEVVVVGPTKEVPKETPPKKSVVDESGEIEKGFKPMSITDTEDFVIPTKDESKNQ